MNEPKKTVQEVLAEKKEDLEKEFLRVLEENGVDPEEAQNALSASPSIGGCGICCC